LVGKLPLAKIRISDFSQNLTNSYREILRQEIEKQYNLFGRAILRQDPKQSKVKMLYGIDFKYDLINTPKIESQSQDMFEVGVFSMINLKITEKLFFQPGLRFGFHSRFLSPISPTANFRFEPNEIICSIIILFNYVLSRLKTYININKHINYVI
jgi:hypothetical protein